MLYTGNYYYNSSGAGWTGHLDGGGQGDGDMRWWLVSWSTTAGRLILLSTGNYVYVPGCDCVKSMDREFRQQRVAEFIAIYWRINYATHCVVGDFEVGHKQGEGGKTSVKRFHVHVMNSRGERV